MKTPSSSRLIPLAGVLASAGGALVTTSGPAQAQTQFYPSPIGVVVNGSYINPGEVPPSIEGGRVLVPLRGVLESLGATVSYNAVTRTVYATRGTVQIQLPLGSRVAYINGAARTLDVPATVVSGRTLVPLRFMSEALGANVNWNAQTRTVFIATTGTAPSNPPGQFPGTTPLPGGQLITLYGTVRRNPSLEGAFEITTETGVVVDVRPRAGVPARLDINDEVELRGTYTGNIFYADTVRITRDTARRVTREATVVYVLANNRLTVRDERGRDVTVVTTNPIPTNITTGDRVRVTGDLRGRTLEKASVTLVRDNAQTTPTGQNVDFGATVISSDTARGTLQVRGDNGVLYLLRYNGFDRFSAGDRVRVQGFYANGITTATQISRQ